MTWRQFLQAQAATMPAACPGYGRADGFRGVADPPAAGSGRDAHTSTGVPIERDGAGGRARI